MTTKVMLEPSGISFVARTDETILHAALNNGLHLEHSCRNGDCGICEAKLISGKVRNQYGVLVSKGIIRTCCSYAQCDVSLKTTYIPELGNIKEVLLPCKIKKIHFPVDDVATITLGLPKNENFTYLPGQYVDLKCKGIVRSYSIANASSNSNELEFHVRCIDNGKFSGLLMDELKVGYLLRFEGPKGTFFVRPGNAPVIFLAGGTGFAPIKAMIEELIASNDQREVYIYWGMPTSSMFYLDVAERWAYENIQVHYIPVVSDCEPNWQGRKGLVHNAVLEDFQELKNYEVYACGSPAMIASAKQDFLARGLMEHNFYADLFTAAKN